MFYGGVPPKRIVDARGIPEMMHRRLQWKGASIHLPVLNTVLYVCVTRKPADDTLPPDRQEASWLLCGADIVTPATALPASNTETKRECMGRWLLGAPSGVRQHLDPTRTFDDPVATSPSVLCVFVKGNIFIEFVVLLVSAASA